MILIIDGYNVLKKVISTQITESDRMSFIRALNRYHKHKKHTLILVFDGGPTHNPSTEIHGAIRVVYSGKESADSYIIDYVHRHKNLDLLVVSSDRELIRAASAVHIPSLDAGLFYSLMRSDLDNVEREATLHGTNVKTAQTNDAELDIIMLEDSSIISDKNDELEQERKPSAQSLTKEERKLLKKIKKL